MVEVLIQKPHPTVVPVVTAPPHHRGLLMQMIEAIMCFVMPPLAVVIHDGTFLTTRFLASVILTVVGWIPGILYALYICFYARPIAVITTPTYNNV